MIMLIVDHNIHGVGDYISMCGCHCVHPLSVQFHACNIHVRRDTFLHSELLRVFNNIRKTLIADVKTLKTFTRK